MAKTTTPLKKERPTPEQIEALKKKHGKLLKINIEEDDMMVIIREPGIQELEKATSEKNKPGALPFDFNRSIVQDCLVYEDEVFFSDDKRTLAVHSRIERFKVVKESTVEEL